MPMHRTKTCLHATFQSSLISEFRVFEKTEHVYLYTLCDIFILHDCS